MGSSEQLVIVLMLVAAGLLIITAPLIIVLRITKRIAKYITKENFVRTDPEKWGYCCTAPENEEQLHMWESGLSWRKEQTVTATEVTVTSAGYKLVGEYLDYGAKRCVIIVPGRGECHQYSYYFAQTYTNANCNILLIDPRAQGHSEGTHITFGVKEKDDMIVWARYAEEALGNEEVYLHGICVGAAACIMAMTSDDCPKSTKKLVVEGVYTSFYESFKQHIVFNGRPVHPVLEQTRGVIRNEFGVDILKQSPEACVSRLTAPVLFIFGKEDKFSVPKESERLYMKCGSMRKSIVWFEIGAHSHLRINNQDEYDKCILSFIEKDYE